MLSFFFLMPLCFTLRDLFAQRMLLLSVGHPLARKVSPPGTTGSGHISSLSRRKALQSSRMWRASCPDSPHEHMGEGTTFIFLRRFWFHLQWPVLKRKMVTWSTPFSDRKEEDISGTQYLLRPSSSVEFIL